MDRFHARASMVFWTLLNYHQYQPSPHPVRKEFEKLFIHYPKINFAQAERALADQKLIVIDPSGMYQVKPAPHRRLIKWPAAIEPFYAPGEFTIKARPFLSVSRGLYRVADSMIKMPLNTLIGSVNLAILEALWTILGGSDAHAKSELFYEPHLIMRILHTLIADHPEVTAGDVYCILHASVIQAQWIERVAVPSHPEETYYRRRQTLQRPIGKANQLCYHQVNYSQTPQTALRR